MDEAEQDRTIDALCAEPLGDAVGDPATRAMLAYADRLTRTPQGVRAEDVEALREAGFDDRAIHDICAIVAYFAFVNRIADGLGVEMESGG